jgi:hypothetical protein
MKLFLLALLLIGLMPTRADSGAAVPNFQMWVECVERGPYAGRAWADVSYRYEGLFPILAEDARVYGDTETGNAIVFPFSLQPGEHLRDMRFNVGALKAVLLKVVFGGKLHVLAIFDDPERPDCPLLPEPRLTPTPPPDV